MAEVAGDAFPWAGPDGPLLAMESSSDAGSVALMDAHGLLQVQRASPGQSHSSQLLPLAQGLLGQANLGWADLSGLAVGIGPGSFTGIRIACGIAQGVSLARNLLCAPVSSFEACAYAWWATHDHRSRQQFLISFDARLGERFAALLEFLSQGDRVSVKWVAPPEVIAESQRMSFAASLRDADCLIELHDPDPMSFGDSPLALAGWIVRYARDARVLKPSSWVLAGGLEPLYVRQKVAQTIAERAQFPDLSWAQMGPADVASVMVIEQQAYPFPWTSGNFLDSLKAGYQLRILKEHGAMVGYVVWMPVLAEAHLLNLTLSPARQGHGLGAWMMRQIMAQMREAGMGRILLEVRPSNVRALGLYRRLGFETIGVRKGYYPNSAVAGVAREDALVMRLELIGNG